MQQRCKLSGTACSRSDGSILGRTTQKLNRSEVVRMVVVGQLRGRRSSSRNHITCACTSLNTRPGRTCKSAHSSDRNSSSLHPRFGAGRELNCAVLRDRVKVSLGRFSTRTFNSKFGHVRSRSLFSVDYSIAPFSPSQAHPAAMTASRRRTVSDSGRTGRRNACQSRCRSPAWPTLLAGYRWWFSCSFGSSRPWFFSRVVSHRGFGRRWVS